MPKNPQVDSYIKDCPSFSHAILTKVRNLIHKVDPSIKEEFKWGCPVYSHNKLIMGMGAFKQHASINFFQGGAMSDKHKLFNYGDANRFNRVIKFTDVSEIDEKKITDYIKEALENDAKGVVAKREDLEIPKDLAAALKKAGVVAKFKGMSYTHRKEHILAILEAKQEETRIRRIATCVESVKKMKK